MTRTVAIVGAGIGARHMAGFAALPEYFRVKAICDLNAARAEAVAKDYPGVSVTTDFDAVLTDPEVDICLPPRLHFRNCMDALDARKIVICEKPLVSSLAEADRLAEKVAQIDGVLSPVFQYRYGFGAAQLHALIEAGLAGRCYAGSLETHWDRPASYYDVDWRGTWAGERGGALLGHAIHVHDLLPSLPGPVARCDGTRPKLPSMLRIAAIGRRPIEAGPHESVCGQPCAGLNEALSREGAGERPNE